MDGRGLGVLLRIQADLDWALYPWGRTRGVNGWTHQNYTPEAPVVLKPRRRASGNTSPESFSIPLLGRLLGTPSPSSAEIKYHLTPSWGSAFPAADTDKGEDIHFPINNVRRFLSSLNKQARPLRLPFPPIGTLIPKRSSEEDEIA